METFSVLVALCVGNYRSPLESRHKGQWRGDLMFSLICAWTNGWVNNEDIGDLRRHRAQYDVTERTNGWVNNEDIGDLRRHRAQYDVTEII